MKTIFIYEEVHPKDFFSYFKKEDMDSYIAKIDNIIKANEITVDEYLFSGRNVEDFDFEYMIERYRRIKSYNESGGTIEWNNEDTFTANHTRFANRDDEAEEYGRFQRMNLLDKKIEDLLK